MVIRKRGVGLVLLLLIFLIPIQAFATSTEEMVSNNQEKDLYSPEARGQLEDALVNEDLFSPEPSDEAIPYQEVPKIPDKKEEKVKAIEGGNEKAINPLATKENRARGTVIENVDRNNEDITPKNPIDQKAVVKNPNPDQGEKIENKGEDQGKQAIDLRQFLTFQTKSGKSFHLIVDHGENQDNVQLLTEVGEQDLLNMIEGESSQKPDQEEVVKKLDPVEEEVEKPEEEEVKEEKKSGIGLYLILGIIMLAVVGAGYYFKFYKKDEEDIDDSYYDEFEDEYEYDGSDDEDDDDDDDDTDIIIPEEDDFA